MDGLKNVRHRRDDALSRIGWADLERLLAAYYRDLGWWVEHVGTAATGARFDGGVDLRLKRDREIVLLQCKHWNAKQVPHDAVHELIGLMVNDGATGAILVSSGEFTSAAIEAASRHGHVRLIDGDGLRDMLGELPEQCGQADPLAPPPRLESGVPHARPRPVHNARRGAWIWWLIALACLLLFVLLVRTLLARTADTAMPPEDSASTMDGGSLRQPPGPRPLDAQATMVEVMPVHVAPYRADDAGDGAETANADVDRRREEAMRVIESTTPEM